ncbi:MAG: hypothetical protein JWR62_379 [Modestobacter sp.]|jgi:hypothetical protein|nr:hypothetical protein [Modestobacter sp.]
MRLLRAVATGVVGSAVLLLTPGVAAADSAIAHRSCERIWIWWIPFPCWSGDADPEGLDRGRS